MDIPLEAINPSPSCHFNSSSFRSPQRLQVCQWNCNKGSSAPALFGERGQAAPPPDSFPQSPEQRCGLLPWLVAGTGLCHPAVPTLSCENRFRLGKPVLHLRSAGVHPAEGVNSPVLFVQLVPGAGSLHSPSPRRPEPSLAGWNRGCLTMRSLFGYDSEPTFIFSTLSVLHLNCSAPLVLLTAGSSIFCDQISKIFTSHNFFYKKKKVAHSQQ